MKNKVMGLVLAGILSVGMVGCGSEPTVSEDKTEIVIENQNAEEFKEKDILTYELETKRKDEYLVMKIKVTNNSDKPINDYFLCFSLYDENGDKIDERCVSDDAVLQPKKSYTDEVWVDKLDAKNVQLTEYNYKVPSEKVGIIINKELETVDVYDLE